MASARPRIGPVGVEDRPAAATPNRPRAAPATPGTSPSSGPASALRPRPRSVAVARDDVVHASRRLPQNDGRRAGAAGASGPWRSERRARRPSRRTRPRAARPRRARGRRPGRDVCGGRRKEACQRVIRPRSRPGPSLSAPSARRACVAADEVEIERRLDNGEPVPHVGLELPRFRCPGNRRELCSRSASWRS